MQVPAAAAADDGDVPVQLYRYMSVCLRVRLSLSLNLSLSLSELKIHVRRWRCGARMRLSPRTKSLLEAHSSRHPVRRRSCLWRWWRGGGTVGIGIGGGSRRIGEEEAGLAGSCTTLWLPRVS